jgi:O-antigen/teichoic acid export membrane protein
MVFTIIITPFWSAFTDAYTKQDYVWMKTVLKKLQMIWLTIIPVVFIMLLLSAFVYKIWIGDAVLIPFTVSLFIALYVLLFTRFSLYIYMINGIGKIQLQLYINVSISLVYIPMAIYSCKWLGLPGIILANILVALIHSIVSQIQIRRLMNGNAKGIWNK